MSNQSNKDSYMDHHMDNHYLSRLSVGDRQITVDHDSAMPHADGKYFIHCRGGNILTTAKT